MAPNCNCADFRNLHQIVPNISSLTITCSMFHDQISFDYDEDILYESVKHLSKLQHLKVLRLDTFNSLAREILCCVSKYLCNLSELHLIEFCFGLSEYEILDLIQELKKLIVLRVDGTKIYFVDEDEEEDEDEGYNGHEDYKWFHNKLLKIIKARQCKLPLHIYGWPLTGEYVRFSNDVWLKFL